MREDNIAILNDTLGIFEKGYYVTDSGKRVDLKLTKRQALKCKVYLPEALEKISNSKSFPHVHALGGRVDVGCENIFLFSCTEKSEICIVPAS